MNYKLVQWTFDYADEFDVFGACVLDSNTFEKHLADSQEILKGRFQEIDDNLGKRKEEFYEAYDRIIDEFETTDIISIYDLPFYYEISNKFRSLAYIFSIDKTKETAFQEWKKDSKMYEGSNFELYFGTNQCIDFYSVDDYIDSLEVKDITKTQYDFLLENFGESWGTAHSFFPLETW
jgi:hypothetical protein